jgi:hypothetical protein
MRLELVASGCQPRSRIFVTIGARGRTVTLKSKFADFELITQSRTLAGAVGSHSELESASTELLRALCPMEKKAVRLLECRFLDFPSEERTHRTDRPCDLNDTNPFPAAHEDAMTAWRFLRRQGIAGQAPASPSARESPEDAASADRRPSRRSGPKRGFAGILNKSRPDRRKSRPFRPAVVVLSGNFPIRSGLVSHE